jgi:hypothetical protein
MFITRPIYNTFLRLLAFCFVLKHIYCISGSERSIIFEWNFCLHLGKNWKISNNICWKMHSFFKISMNICWNSFQRNIHWNLIYYLLKFQ